MDNETEIKAEIEEFFEKTCITEFGFERLETPPSGACFHHFSTWICAIHDFMATP